MAEVYVHPDARRTSSVGRYEDLEKLVVDEYLISTKDLVAWSKRAQQGLSSCERPVNRRVYPVQPDARRTSYVGRYEDLEKLVVDEYSTSTKDLVAWSKRAQQALSSCERPAKRGVYGSAGRSQDLLRRTLRGPGEVGS
ncbi:hypothetical protein [Lewinella sp. 4G2]|uniref:hypothetical protein n=1 Tax=Lewinella sp. 4G2 TaxID=1803372 RepID=UPI0012FA398C|nr:hypothetical protein [Lewinella sp. 4G2]